MTVTDRGTRRVNCNPKELKRGLLQSELWLEKEAQQNLATSGLQKQTKEQCDEEKEKTNERSNTKLFQAQDKFFITLKVMRILSKLPAPFRQNG